MQFTTRQIEIIQAATKIVGEKGIQNLTTKNLAKEMSFSEAALYRHFKNKNVIISSILQYYQQDIKDVLAEILQKDDQGLIKMGNVIKFLFNRFMQNPAIIMIIFAETSFQNDINLSKQVNSILNQKKTAFEKIIEKGQHDGSIRNDIPKQQVSAIFMGSLRFTVLRWRLSNMNYDLKKEGELLWDSLSKMISGECV